MACVFSERLLITALAAVQGQLRSGVVIVRDNWRMIDLPNLLAGFALGLIPTLAVWMIDRGRAKRQRVLDARVAWMSAAKEIELATNPQTTAGSLYLARVRHPVDLWRSILGPDHFVALERLESAFQNVEGLAQRLAARPAEPGDDQAMNTALAERLQAYIAFANLSREMQSRSYTDIVRKEQRQQLRRDYVRHPLRTLLRERRNRKARRATA